MVWSIPKVIPSTVGSPTFEEYLQFILQIFKNEAFITAAQRFADVIWERGLLRKGYVLCHGVSGNAYGLLCIYQLTKNQTYLWKALKVKNIKLKSEKG